MPLSTAEMQKIANTAITHYGKNKPVDQINVERPLLDIMRTKAKKLKSGADGYTVNVHVSNDANGQYVSGNGRVNYNTRNPNRVAKFDHSFYHDGLTINEDELYRNGITVNDDDGKRMSTVNERVQLANMLESQMYSLNQGAYDFCHAAMWLDGSQFADAQPGIDAICSLTPATGTIGNLAASNAWWQNEAYTGVGSTYAALTDALEQGKRNIMRKKGRITHYFAGGAMIDALRNAAVGLNASQIQYQSGNKLRIELATDKLTFDGKEIVYVPDFDEDFGYAAPAVPWTKRLYGLNLEQGFNFRKDADDFEKIRYAGRPIDQYAYYIAITSKFSMDTAKRGTNMVMALA